MDQTRLFWWSLTSKYTKHTLLLCFSPVKVFHLLFMLSFGLQKHKPYLSTTFQTPDYLKRTLIHAFPPLNTSCVHGLLHLNLKKHHFYLGIRFFTTVDFIYCLYWGSLALNPYTLYLVSLFTATTNNFRTIAQAL